MIEIASNHRITKVSHVFPWTYGYTSRVDRVWDAAREMALCRLAHGRAKYLQ
jgi:hypothetical protein